MPITEEQAHEIVMAMIANPSTNIADVPAAWEAIIATSKAHFHEPLAEEPKKKRRRKTANPNIGWPAGVKRADYKAWKEGQLARGISFDLNPQAYKRTRDAAT